jgi:hypothetical protein
MSMNQDYGFGAQQILTDNTTRLQAAAYAATVPASLNSVISSCEWQPWWKDWASGQRTTQSSQLLQSTMPVHFVGQASVLFDNLPASVRSALSVQYAQWLASPEYQHYLALGNHPTPSTLSGQLGQILVLQNDVGTMLSWPASDSNNAILEMKAVCIFPQRSPGRAVPISLQGLGVASDYFAGFGQSPTDLQSLGQAVLSAFAADPNGCSNVCISGTAVNSAVYAFKVAWNQTGWGVDPVPAGTGTLPGADAFATYGPLTHNGQYDQAAASAIAATGLTGVLGPCTTTCAAPSGPTAPTAAPVGPTAPAVPTTPGGTNYLPWILGGAAVVGLGVIGWSLFSKPKAEALHGKARAAEEETRQLRDAGHHAQARDKAHAAKQLHAAARHHMALEEEEDRLTYQQRKHLPNSAFALPEKRYGGKGGLPITDAAHIRNAAARLSMMRHRGSVTPAQYRRARTRIIRAACRHGVEKTCRAHLG